MKNIKSLLALVFWANLSITAQSPRFNIVKKNTMEGTKMGVVDNRTGLEIIPASYDKILPEHDGKFAIIKDQLLGYADTTGKIVIPVQYKDGISFDEGRAFVFNGTKWGMIDEKGKIQGQAIYDDIIGLSEGVGRVMLNNKIGFVNRAGVQIVPCKYPEAYDCAYGLILAYSTVKDVWGETAARGGQKVNYGITQKVPIIYNDKGAVIYKGEPGETVEYTNTGKIFIQRTTTYPGGRSIDRTMVLDNTGKTLIPFDKNYYLTIYDDWIRIKVTDGIFGMGIMDHDCNILLKPNFQSIDSYIDYPEGRFAKVWFKDGRTYFYINESARCVEFNGIKCPE